MQLLKAPQRRLLSTSMRRLQKFQSAAAPPPSSLPTARAPMNRWTKRVLIVGGLGATLYSYDRYYNAHAWLRAGKCVYDLMYVGVDYKLNFKEGRDIEALHERSAERIYNLMIHNKGLYIKMGQAAAIQAAIFPKPFQERFGLLFDAAPQDAWSEVEKVLRTELKEDPDKFFDYIDHRAVASASIAQVHRARLKTGEWVAVKVQHADLEKQVNWDLAAYKWLMWIYERYLFKFPIYFVAEHVAERLEREIDFRYELENAEGTRNSILADATLRKHLYVPQNYPELSTGRVLVSEWIEGIPMSKKAELEVHRYDFGNAMNWLINLYSKQIFEWGDVHCDPHPGNVILRRVKGKQQVVLIDHGLYIKESPDFRKQYSSFWEGIFTVNTDLIAEVSKAWGFGDSEMLASATMLQNFKPKQDTKPDHQMTAQEEFQMHAEMRERFKNFLTDTTKIPLELIFLGRTMRIIQGLNRKFGSPVNRVKIFAKGASAANRKEKSRQSLLRAWRDYIVFWSILIASDIAFLLVRTRQLFFGVNAKGAEDLLEQQMREAAKEMGFEYQDTDDLD